MSLRDTNPPVSKAGQEVDPWEDERKATRFVQWAKELGRADWNELSDELWIYHAPVLVKRYPTLWEEYIGDRAKRRIMGEEDV